MTTLATMSKEDADRLGVPETHRRTSMRADSAKLYLAPAPGQCEWDRLVGIRIENGALELRPTP